MSARTLPRSLLAVVALLVLLPTSALHAQQGPSLGIRLVDAPVGREDDPRAQNYIVDHLAQGATITRHIELSSTDTNPVQVALYAAAATVADGQFEFGDGHAENDLTDWTSVEPGSVSVPPNGTIQAEVKIAVPTDAPSGEQYGVIWAELPGSGGDANVVNRVGVRIYLSVGEGAEPKSDFTIDALTARKDAEGTPIVETKVTNTGGRAIDLTGTLVLENGPGGLNTKPYDVKIGTTLAPGESAPAQIVLDKSLPDGPWDATVKITAGRLEHEAKASITFPAKAGVEARPVSAASADEKQRKTLIPVAAAAVVVVAAATAAFFLIGRRRALQAARAAGKAIAS
jgi:hypothetical protein